MIVFKRKQVVIVVILCMILAAGYINWAYQPEGATEPVSGDETKYLGEAEMVSAEETDSETRVKEDARNKAMELLDEIVNNPSADEESKKSALSQLAQMADNMEKEGICEGILNSKGIGKAVVYIADGTATVTIKTNGELTADAVAKINDVILSNTDIAADKVKISKVS